MKKTKITKGLGAMGALAGAIALAITALPHMATAAAAVALEEVVVTARKREESIQDVPQAVSVLSARDIKASSYDIRDIEFVAPNIIIESGNANTSSLSIRGVSLSDLEKSFDPAVGVMIDDVFLGSTTAGLLSTFDMERIEILRGPQGTLQGKNTTGGLIKLVRTRPTGELGGKVSVALGSDDLVDLKALINFPIIEDVLAGKLSYYSKDGGGYMKNLANGKTDGDMDFQSYTASLLWTPTDDFEAQYTYTRDRDDADAMPFVNSSPDDSFLCGEFGGCDSTIKNPRAHNSPEDMPASFDVDLHILRLDWNLGHHQLTAISGYRDLDEEITMDYDASDVDLFTSQRPATDKTFSQEIRVASQWSDKFDYVAGYFYWDREYTMDQTTTKLFNNSYFTQGGSRSTLQAQETDTWSVFFQTDIHLSETLTVTLGARYTDEEKKSHTDVLYTAVDGTLVSGIGSTTVIGMPAVSFDAKDSWSELTPKVGLSYTFDNDAMVYASYTEGFRSGGYNGRARSLSALGPYEPETVKTWEFGLKSDWMDGRLRFNPTIFFTDYEDKQEELATFIGNSPLTIVENASNADISGLELEVQYLVGGLRLSANYGYLDSEYDDYTVIDANGNVTDKSDNWLLLAPEQTFAITSEYTHAVAAFGGGDMTYQLGMKYRDEYQTSGDNPKHGIVDSYSVINSHISYENNDFKVTLYGKNLTDEDYRPFTKNVTVATTGASLWSFSTVNPPRTLGVEVVYYF